jgi:hypothetical protein
LFTSLGCTWKGRPNNNLTQKKSGMTKYLQTKKGKEHCQEYELSTCVGTKYKWVL